MNIDQVKSTLCDFETILYNILKEIADKFDEKNTKKTKDDTEEKNYVNCNSIYKLKHRIIEMPNFCEKMKKSISEKYKNIGIDLIYNSEIWHQVMNEISKYSENKLENQSIENNKELFINLKKIILYLFSKIEEKETHKNSNKNIVLIKFLNEIFDDKEKRMEFYLLGFVHKIEYLHNWVSYLFRKIDDLTPICFILNFSRIISNTKKLITVLELEEYSYDSFIDNKMNFLYNKNLLSINNKSNRGMISYDLKKYEINIKKTFNYKSLGFLKNNGQFYRKILFKNIKKGLKDQLKEYCKDKYGKLDSKNNEIKNYIVSLCELDKAFILIFFCMQKGKIMPKISSFISYGKILKIIISSSLTYIGNKTDQKMELEQILAKKIDFLNLISELQLSKEKVSQAIENIVNIHFFNSITTIKQLTGSLYTEVQLLKNHARIIFSNLLLLIENENSEISEDYFQLIHHFL